MKAGQGLQEFSINGGRKVVLRTPKWKDLDNLLELVNSVGRRGGGGRQG